MTITDHHISWFILNTSSSISLHVLYSTFLQKTQTHKKVFILSRSGRRQSRPVPKVHLGSPGNSFTVPPLYHGALTELPPGQSSVDCHSEKSVNGSSNILWAQPLPHSPLLEKFPALADRLCWEKQIFPSFLSLFRLATLHLPFLALVWSLRSTFISCRSA